MIIARRSSVLPIDAPPAVAAGASCPDNRRVRSSALLAIVGAVLGACVACGTSGGGMDGDCSLRVRLDGRTYDATVLPSLSHDLVRQPYATGAKLTATEIDCDGSTVDRIDVRQIQGVPLADALFVDDGSGELTPYFNSTLHTAPLAFRSATLPVRCSRPVSFTGRIDSIGDQDYGAGDLTPPYTAQVLASAGTGLPFEEWAVMDIDVHVTTALPDPPTREQLDTAIADRTTVAVTAHCDASTFVADSVTFEG